MNASALLAVDIGNSRIKFGVFRDSVSFIPGELPACDEMFAVSSEVSTASFEKLRTVCGEQTPRCIVASVNPPATERFLAEWRKRGWHEPIVIDSYRQLPIVNETSPPEQTGMDRLLKGVAGNVLRRPGESLILVDSGTATTVDRLTAAGAFAGGAILPGLGLSSRALHDYTAKLPLIASEDFEQQTPPPLGRNTQEALRSGLYWGHVGAVRELMTRLSSEAANKQSSVLFTGGAGQLLARELGMPNHYHRDLTLQGLALAAHHLKA